MDKNKYTATAGLLVFLSILFLSWAFIYPTYSSFPGGLDTFGYQNLAKTIIHYGEIKWLLHPLSAWGMYPFSENIGAPVFLANFNILTGLNMPKAILALDYIFITITAFSSYLLFLKIERKQSFALIGCFGFTMAPRILGYLVFIFEARALVVFLTPIILLLIVLMLRSNKNTKIKLIPLISLSLLVTSFTHLNFLFLLPLIFSYVLVKGINTSIIRKALKPGYLFYQRPRKRKIINLIFWVGLFTIILFSLFRIATWELPTRRVKLEAYQERGFMSGEGRLVTLANVFVSMGAGAGIGFVMLGLLGFLSLVVKRRKKMVHTLMLISFLLSIPFMMTSVYFRPFFVLYASFLMGYGFLWIKNRDISVIPIILIVLILVIGSIPFSNFMVQRWTKEIPENLPGSEAEQAPPYFYLNQPLYESSTYLRYTDMDKEERFTTRLQPLDSSKLQLLSNKTPYGNPMALGEIEKIMDKEGWEVKRNEGDIFSPYVSDPPRHRMYTTIFHGASSRVETNLRSTNITVIYSKVFDGNETYSRFIENNHYKIHENEHGILWQV